MAFPESSTDVPSSASIRKIVTGRLVTDGEVIDEGLVALEADRIVYAGTAAEFSLPGWDANDASLQRQALPLERTIMPGLVDIHCHGGDGGDFPGGDEDSARQAIDFLHKAGTTTLLASMVTAAEADLIKGIELYVRLSNEGLIHGIHLEGPFLSHARCGAQNPAFLLSPDLSLAARLVAAGQGKLKTMTYAPELEDAGALVDFLAAHGVTPSLGHTDCDDQCAEESLAGAKVALSATSAGGRPTVTHLFNGMPPMHHRAPGPVAASLRAAASGLAAVELIGDNTHLDPRTVRSVFEWVGGENVVLVTDSMAAAGLSDGAYMLGPSPVTVTDGVATLDATGSIAGGTATLLQVIQRTVAAGVPLPIAVRSATAVPAAVLGLSHEVGSLKAGYRADLVVVDAQLQLAGVVRGGRWL
ncbi:N-acetylglucosamine-6-phosphate deacetylase [Pseudarthrobacter sp. J1763]|uniref:N-acetylglucosamine-6-phosphate deacetylase n=1 Tax=Pseudarthrobacter sp. J1763 TaxID=3420445 RepID=UPI003D2C01E2